MIINFVHHQRYGSWIPGVFERLVVPAPLVTPIGQCVDEAFIDMTSQNGGEGCYLNCKKT